MNLSEAWTAALDDYVIDLAWSPDGAHLAAAASNGPVSLFSTAKGDRTHLLPGHDDGTNCIAWAPAAPLPSSFLNLESILATGGQDGKVKLWDATTGQLPYEASLGSAWVEHLAWCPLGINPNSKTQIPKLAASAGRELVFLRADGTTLHTFKPAPKTIAALAWHPGGGCCAAAYFGGVCLWDADDFIAQKEMPYGNAILALTWSPDGRWLVSGNHDRSVHLWIPEKDEELHMSGYDTKLAELSFDKTSRWLATGGGNDVCVWDCSGAGPEGREPTMLARHKGRVSAVAFQHDHGLLASAAADGTLALWNTTRRQPLLDCITLSGPVTKLAWSSDDTLLAAGCENGAVFVFKIAG
jgi:WD40 repeat protein